MTTNTLRFFTTLAVGGALHFIAHAAIPPRHHQFDSICPTVHDPVVARENGKYYIFATGMGVGQMTSPDLKVWRPAHGVMPEIPNWAVDTVPGYRGHTWAPDIQKVGGKWLLYYSCSTFGRNTSAIGLMSNSTLDPQSPDYRWEDQGVVVQSRPGLTDWNAIDPNLIIDEKGQPWLTWGSFWDGIQLVQLAPDHKTPLAYPVTIARRYSKDGDRNMSAADRERAAQAPDAGANAIEAPFIIRCGEWYYLFVSWDYCCKGENSNYKTVVGRSKSVGGPYLDRNGVDMAQGGGTLVAGPDDQYYGVGHCSVYDFDGQWHFFAHGYSAAHDGESKLVHRKLSFDDEGWPSIVK